MVQTANGRVHYLDGENLPDSISLYTGFPYRGAHMAEVLMSPKEAKGVPLWSEPSGWLSKRDAFFIVLGMVFLRVIVSLADAIALALS
jgi:hypothetical protein